MQAPSPEHVARLLEACAVLAAPPTHAAVADANGWIMGLAQSDECWPTCLAALAQTAPSDGHVLLSLCLSLVRQNRLTHAPSPEMLVPFVRHVWAGATEATPVRRQACTLLCALACVDAHECDRLIGWALGLGVADVALALHALQDVGFEAFHRPLQSKPLSKLLRDASGDVLAFVEARAVEPSLRGLALACLQQWVHAGVVLSDLVDLPNLANGLVASLKDGASWCRARARTQHTHSPVRTHIPAVLQLTARTHAPCLCAPHACTRIVPLHTARAASWGARCSSSSSRPSSACPRAPPPSPRSCGNWPPTSRPHYAAAAAAAAAWLWWSARRSCMHSRAWRTRWCGTRRVSC
eukprot:7116957-Prymnesium_polylepis.1